MKLSCFKTNQGTKMGLIHDYLMSPEFVQTIERICTTYKDMTEQLHSEKRAFNKLVGYQGNAIEKLQNQYRSICLVRYKG